MTWKAYMTFAPLLLLGVKYAGVSMFILSIRKNLSWNRIHYILDTCLKPLCHAVYFTVS